MPAICLVLWLFHSFLVLFLYYKTASFTLLQASYASLFHLVLKEWTEMSILQILVVAFAVVLGPCVEFVISRFWSLRYYFVKYVSKC